MNYDSGSKGGALRDGHWGRGGGGGGGALLNLGHFVYSTSFNCLVTGCLLIMAALLVAFLNRNFFSFCFRSSSTAHTFKFCAWRDVTIMAHGGGVKRGGRGREEGERKEGRREKGGEEEGRREKGGEEEGRREKGGEEEGRREKGGGKRGKEGERGGRSEERESGRREGGSC